MTAALSLTRDGLIGALAELTRQAPVSFDRAAAVIEPMVYVSILTSVASTALSGDWYIATLMGPFALAVPTFLSANVALAVPMTAGLSPAPESGVRIAVPVRAATSVAS